MFRVSLSTMFPIFSFGRLLAAEMYGPGQNGLSLAAGQRSAIRKDNTSTKVSKEKNRGR